MRKELFLPHTQIVDKKRAIVSYCEGKNVLDVGMGGHIDNSKKNEEYFQQDLDQTLHGQISKVAKSLDGLDINELAIQAASSVYKGQYFIGDLTDETLYQTIGKQYDVIVLGDVIEHLDQHRPALMNLKQLLKPDGILIITTVNAYCIDAILKMAFRYESVHEEHTCYFSYITMQRLLTMNGYQIEGFQYYRNQRKKFGSVLHRLGVAIKNATTCFFPQYEMGLLFVARAVN